MEGKEKCQSSVGRKREKETSSGWIILMPYGDDGSLNGSFFLYFCVIFIYSAQFQWFAMDFLSLSVCMFVCLFVYDCKINGLLNDSWQTYMNRLINFSMWRAIFQVVSYWITTIHGTRSGINQKRNSWTLNGQCCLKATKSSSRMEILYF